MAVTINQKIVQWVTGQLGKKVDRGECWDLAEKALKLAGAKTSNDLCEVKPDTDYIWGTQVAAKDAIPGDIVQFRDFVVTEGGDMLRSTPHHTAIIQKIDTKEGLMDVLEQNIKPIGKKVQSNEINYRSSERNIGSIIRKDASNQIKVEGKFWIYRPIKKSAD